MRILHIGKYYPPVAGGMERFLADLVGVQRAAGDEVMVLVHDDGRPLAEPDPDWVVRCPVWLKFLFAPISPSFGLRLWRIIRQFRPEVLHIHLPNPSPFWALLLPAARCLPWVIHWHSDVETGRFPWSLRLAYISYALFECALLDHAEAVVVTSPPYLASSRPLRPWLDKCVMVPLAVDLARLPEVEDADSRSWQPGRVRLLAIGRLTYYKGFDTLIRAVAGQPELQLLIVGEGEEHAALDAVLTELGSPDNIRLAGALRDGERNALLASCDLFCLPSLERTEAFGIVLMEAMRYGRPVVASDLQGSGVTWVVRDGENGVLVPPGDVSAWSSTLASLASDPVRRDRLAAKGRERFFCEFDIAGVARGLAGLYRRIQKVDEAWTVAPARNGGTPLIVIPALNEAGTIGTVIAKLRALGYSEVVVIDDGSTDETARVAREHGARVLRAPLRQGAWGAMQTGIRYAVTYGYEGVVTIDADGQHEPQYISTLLAESGSADVVVAACTARGSWMRRVAWAYFRLLTGFRLEDLTSGFRFYNAKACQVLAQEEATLLDYQDVGVLLLLHRSGMRICEVPVTMSPRSNGASRIFSSWWVVGRYMIETTLLCLARWKAKPFSRS